MTKKIFAVILTFALLLSLVILPASAESILPEPAVTVTNTNSAQNSVTFWDCDYLEGAIGATGNQHAAITTSGTLSIASDVGHDAYIQSVYNGVDNVNLTIRVDGPVVAPNARYLEFDLYLSDPTVMTNCKTNDSQIEISSSRDSEDDEIYWNQNYMRGATWLEEGWNHIRLDLTKYYGTNTKAETDFNNFRRFRFYFLQDAAWSGTVGIDNICLTDDGVYDELSLLERDEVLSVGTWFPLTGYRDAIRVNNPATGSNSAALSKMLQNPVNISEMENIEFDLWMSDVANFNTASGDMVVELNSNGATDKNEVNYSMTNFKNKLSKGWNHVVIPLSAFGLANAEQPFDNTSVKYFRMYLRGEGLQFALGNIVFTNRHAIHAEGESHATDIALPDGDTSFWTTGTAAEELSVNGKTAVASVQTQENASQSVAFNLWGWASGSYNLTNVNAVDFWLYTENPNLFKDGGDVGINLVSEKSAQITWNTQEQRITADQMKGLNLVKGWNHICLPITENINNDDNYVVTDVRSVRIYCARTPLNTVMAVANFRFIGDTETTGGGKNPYAEVVAENGAVTASGDAFLYGTDAVFTLESVNVGYRFTGWQVNGDSRGTDTTLTVNMTEDITVTALFEALERGDVSADGSVDADDLALLRKHLLSAASADTYAADVNNDGEINVKDLVALKKKF